MPNAPLVAVDTASLYERNVGSMGLANNTLDTLRPTLEAVYQALHARVQSGELPFLRLHEDTATVTEIQNYAHRAHERQRLNDCVVLGIGGSSLGTQALVQALGAGRIRIHCCDNIDPEPIGALLNGLDLKRTLFLSVTKSGNTLETVAQTLLVRERLQRALSDEEYRQNLAVITNPTSGFARELAQQDGLTTFDVPPNVGGRFSALTPVGLVPAALAGIDIQRLMAGAAWAAAGLASPDPHANPPLAVAGLLHTLATQHGRSILFTLPYSNALATLGDWFAQLWAESLGKNGVGTTPVTAVGATAQHSLLQLWMEGPPNATIQFLEVRQHRSDITIGDHEFSDWNWLTGHSLGSILNTEKQATEQALTQAERPNLTWLLPAIEPENVAAWMVWMEAMTAYAGGLYGVDPFDQPGVEAGKRIARDLLIKGIHKD
jgi:glucose-6-phosphate isomerase